MFPMEDDDIFQVDKADLIQGPTLAELNANDESLLTDFNFDDFVMPSQATGRNINRPINRPDVFNLFKFKFFFTVSTFFPSKRLMFSFRHFHE